MSGPEWEEGSPAKGSPGWGTRPLARGVDVYGESCPAQAGDMGQGRWHSHKPQSASQQNAVQLQRESSIPVDMLADTILIRLSKQASSVI